jgi:hypothetical protein
MHARKALHQRTFPGPILSHDGNNLAGTEGSAYSLKGTHSPEALTYCASL